MERVFVGMDVHKEKIVGIGFAGTGTYPVWRGEFGGDVSAVVKHLVGLSKRYELLVCYEAGPCGYGLARALLAKGINCRIVAPSLVPKRPGNRVKTDVRDATELASCLRSETLTFVRIPSEEEESIRGLIRCREDIAGQVRRLKQVVSHWLLTRGRRKPLRAKNWGPAYWTWVRALELPLMDRTVLDHYLDALRLLEERLKLIEREIVALADTDEYRKKVTRLRAFRGFSVLGAMRLIAEVMEFHRFGRAISFMKFAGLTPSEFSSSDRIRRGRITKAGNGLLRHVLVEAVQNLRPGTQSKMLMQRMKELCSPLRDIAVRCLGRLRTKFRRLTARGVPSGKAKIAMARELAGFVWAMMTASAAA